MSERDQGGGDSRILITRLDGKILTALWDGSRVAEFRAEEEKEDVTVGDIRIGRVCKVVKNIGAAFVEIRPGVNCFLQVPRGKKLNQGEEILVQVTREAVSTKDPVISASVSLPGRYLVLVTDRSRVAVSSRIRGEAKRDQLQQLLQAFLSQRAANILADAGITEPDAGFIIRTNAAEAEEKEILSEAESLLREYAEIHRTAPFRTVFSVLRRGTPAWLSAIRDSASGGVATVITDQPDLFSRLQEEEKRGIVPDDIGIRFYEDPAISLVNLYRLRHFLDTALGRCVWLKSGGFLIIDRTEAMTVIDVNSGKYSGKKQQEQTFLRINLEAAEEVAFQLRLRNLSGIIIVDFIDMQTEASWQELKQVLRRELGRDPQRAELVDFTALGLAEITRKKTRKPLDEQMNRRGRSPQKMPD